MPQIETEKTEPGWYPYDLDYYAQQLVLDARNGDNVLNESHKMRMAVAYGLERFWGEHLRLKRESRQKSCYWKAVWDQLEDILKLANVTLPNDNVTSTLPDRTKEEKRLKDEDERQKIQAMSKRIWQMPPSDKRIALMVLSQLCDSLVWWTQRYKLKKDN